MISNIKSSSPVVSQPQEHVSVSVTINTRYIVVIAQGFIALIVVRYITMRRMIHLNPRRF